MTDVGGVQSREEHITIEALGGIVPLVPLQIGVLQPVQKVGEGAHAAVVLGCLIGVLPAYGYLSAAPAAKPVTHVFGGLHHLPLYLWVRKARAQQAQGGGALLMCLHKVQVPGQVRGFLVVYGVLKYLQRAAYGRGFPPAVGLVQPGIGQGQVAHGTVDIAPGLHVLYLVVLLDI